MFNVVLFNAMSVSHQVFKTSPIIRSAMPEMIMSNRRLKKCLYMMCLFFTKLEKLIFPDNYPLGWKCATAHFQSSPLI